MTRVTLWKKIMTTRSYGDSPVTLVSPPSITGISPNLTATFRWEPPLGTGTYSYRVFLYKQNFQDTDESLADGSTNQMELSFPGLSNGRYVIVILSTRTDLPTNIPPSLVIIEDVIKMSQ